MSTNSKANKIKKTENKTIKKEYTKPGSIDQCIVGVNNFLKEDIPKPISTDFSNVIRHEQGEDKVNTKQIPDFFPEKKIIKLDKEYYTTKDLTKMCPVTSTTIITYCRTGVIKTVKTLGGHRRIPKAEVEKVLKIMGIM